MLITFVISISVFAVSIFISYIWINFFNNFQFLFLLPIVLTIFVLLYVIEFKISEKYRLNRTVYNVVVMQFPAIISILFSLILYIINCDYYVIKILLSAGKYVLIPIMLIRLIIEFISKRKISLIISCGITLGLIMGILIINSIL